MPEEVKLIEPTACSTCRATAARRRTATPTTILPHLRDEDAEHVVDEGQGLPFIDQILQSHVQDSVNIDRHLDIIGVYAQLLLPRQSGPGLKRNAIQHCEIGIGPECPEVIRKRGHRRQVQVRSRHP